MYIWENNNTFKLTNGFYGRPCLYFLSTKYKYNLFVCSEVNMAT